MEGEILRFRLYKILHGPVQKAFVYVFHQTYAQTCSVYEFALQHPDNFIEEELLSLQCEKNVKCHKIPLLFSVIKASCNPPLAPPTSNAWIQNGIKLSDSDNLSLENVLTCLLNIYEDSANLLMPPALEEFNAITADIRLLLQRAIEEAGKFDVSGRWKEVLEEGISCLDDIKAQENFPEDMLADDIKTELHMSYHLYNPKGLNPLLLKLILLPDREQQTISKKHRKDPEVMLEVSNVIKAIPSEDLKSSKRLCLISGEPGCGRSNLGFLLAAAWSKKNGQIANIDSYEAVLLMSGISSNIEDKDLMFCFLPLCSLVHGTDKIRKWLLSSRVLLVIDDAEELSSSYISDLISILQESDTVHAVMLTSPLDMNTTQNNFKNYVCSKLKVCGFGREQIMRNVDTHMHYKQINNFSDLKEFLVLNICRLEKVLKYPTSLLDACEAWIDDPDIYDEDVTTCTDLLWTITMWKINKAIRCSLEIDAESKIKEWLLVAGSQALKAIKDNSPYEKSYMEELEGETAKIFTAIPSQNIMRAVFKRKYIQGNRFHSEYSILHKLQQDFLAAWYVAHQLIDCKKLKLILGGRNCPYDMAIFMAGLIPKIHNYRWISNLHERRLISAVVDHAEGISEDLDFNMNLVAEVKGLLKLVEIIVDFCEYPDEWNIDAGDAQVIPIESLLFQVAPTRIFLNVEELKPYSELNKVISFLCRVVIFLWLDSTSQFQYGCPKKMDQIAKSFFGEKPKVRIDLLNGCMSSKVLKEIPSHVAFSYLVYLKLRIIDWKNFSTVVKVSKNLPKLLWLEIKFDFPVLEEDVATTPKTTVPLIDVHLQGIEDSSVSKLANLLGGLHNCYTGIHLENTSLTPEGVFVLLKQLQKRRVYLHSPPEHREKFRRWYYPQLSKFDKNTELTDEQAIKLLGFDDRIYYSNHCVTSSCFALALDSWNLASYLEEEKHILQFTYKTDNLTCIKGLGGSVNIMVDGERQVRKTKTQSENSLANDH